MTGLGLQPFQTDFAENRSFAPFCLSSPLHFILDAEVLLKIKVFTLVLTNWKIDAKWLATDNKIL